jgi:hypothetical protein
MSTTQSMPDDVNAAFKCVLCNKPFRSALGLRGHKASPGHKKKAKLWTAGGAR